MIKEGHMNKRSFDSGAADQSMSASCWIGMNDIGDYAINKAGDGGSELIDRGDTNLRD